MLRLFAEVKLNLPDVLFKSDFSHKLTLSQQINLFRELLEEEYSEDLAKCLTTLELIYKDNGRLSKTGTTHDSIFYKVEFQVATDVKAFEHDFTETVGEL